MPVTLFIDGDASYNAAQFNVPVPFYTVDKQAHARVPVVIPAAAGTREPWSLNGYNLTKMMYAHYQATAPGNLDRRALTITNTIQSFYNALGAIDRKVSYFKTDQQSQVLERTADELATELEQLCQVVLTAGRDELVANLLPLQTELNQLRDRLRFERSVGREIHAALPVGTAPGFSTTTYISVTLICGVLCATGGFFLAPAVIAAVGATGALTTAAITVGTIAGGAGAGGTVGFFATKGIDYVLSHARQIEYQELLDNEQKAYEDCCLALKKGGLDDNFIPAEVEAAERARTRIQGLRVGAAHAPA